MKQNLTQPLHGTKVNRYFCNSECIFKCAADRFKKRKDWTWQVEKFEYTFSQHSANPLTELTASKCFIYQALLVPVFGFPPLCSLHNVSGSEMFLTLLECTVGLRSSYRFSTIFQSGAWEVHSKKLISCISWFIWKHVSYHYFAKLSKLSSALISSVNMEHQLVRYIDI